MIFAIGKMLKALLEETTPDAGGFPRDLNAKPYCCACNPKLGYDARALVPQWHKDKWKGYKCPLVEFGDPGTLGTARIWRA